MFRKLKKKYIIVWLSVLVIVIAGITFIINHKKIINTITGSERSVVFGYINSVQLHNPAVMIMKEKKLLEAEGLQVKWIEYFAEQYAMQDMAVGAVDFVTCGVVPVMSTHAHSVKLAVIAGSNQEGSSLIVDNSINTVEDLQNKKIATPSINSSQDALLNLMAAENKLRIRHVTMRVPDMADFLAKKEIDGFFAWAPYPSGAVEQNFGHELLSASDILPCNQCCVLATTEKNFWGKHSVVKKVLKVYLDAYKWFLANREESIKLLSKNIGVPESLVRQAILTVKYPYPPYCNTDSMYSLARELIDTHIITNIRADGVKPFIENLYHPELIELLTVSE